jgi:hypothetical protein
MRVNHTLLCEQLGLLLCHPTDLSDHLQVNELLEASPALRMQVYWVLILEGANAIASLVDGKVSRR